MFGSLKNSCTFVMSRNGSGDTPFCKYGRKPKHLISGALISWIYSSPLNRVLTAGEATPLFYWSQFINVKERFKMRDSPARKGMVGQPFRQLQNGDTSSLRKSHKDSRHELLRKLIIMSKTELINNLLIEMDAKNDAYYYIIESGQMNAFGQYCLKPLKYN